LCPCGEAGVRSRGRRKCSDALLRTETRLIPSLSLEVYPWCCGQATITLQILFFSGGQVAGRQTRTWIAPPGMASDRRAWQMANVLGVQAGRGRVERELAAARTGVCHRRAARFGLQQRVDDISSLADEWRRPAATDPNSSHRPVRKGLARPGMWLS
jgi:hypothetical protein